MSNIYISASISGILAGLAAIICTWLIERFGGILGGVLCSVPTTIVPASVGFYLQHLSKVKPVLNGLYSEYDRSALLKFQRCLLVVPMGLLINSTFLYMWKVVPSSLLKIFPSLENRLKVFLLIICVITISTWFIEAITSVFLLISVTSSSDPQLEFNSPELSPFLIVTDSLERPVFIIGIVSLLLQILFGIATSWNIMSAPKGKNAVTYLQILTRGFLAGVAVFIAVIISKVSPFAAGIASIFPAMTITTMVSVWLLQGRAVAQGAIGPIILGSASVSVYCIFVSFFMAWFQKAYVTGVVYVAIFVSWCSGVIVTSLPGYLFLKWREGINLKLYAESVRKMKENASKVG